MFRTMRGLVSVTLLAAVAARPGTMGRLPPLGWNTWCTGNKCSNDWCTSSEVLDVAQTIKDSGLLALGYEYINLDDCWGIRNKTTQKIEGDPTRFPEGMPKFIQKVHDLGFKFGLYTDIGSWGCHLPFTGSWPYYQEDANTFAEWQVDYVKFDSCGRPDPKRPNSARDLTGNFSHALDNSGREMWLNFHCWNPDDGAYCAKYGNSFRIAVDHADHWQSTKDTIGALSMRRDFWGPDPDYGWPDADFVFTGGQGCGGDAGPAGQRCPGQTDTEYITEFSMWAIASGSIIFATDPRNMSELQKKILFNEEILKVYRDTSGFRSVKEIGGGVWQRPLKDGEVAVALFNKDDSAKTMTVSFKDIPEKAWEDTTELSVRDLWEHADLGLHSGNFTATDVPAHGTVVVKLTPKSYIDIAV